MSSPTGALTHRKQFDEIPLGARFYVVWKGQARRHMPRACLKLRMIDHFECLISVTKEGHTRESIFLDNKGLLGVEYNTKRGINGYLFTNYFHAYAYTLRLRDYEGNT